VILVNGAAAVGPLLQVTSSIPVVFVQTTDPVGACYVGSLARPGGTATGFALPEYSSSGKWLELLKQIAPRTRRAVVLRDQTTATGLGQFGAIQSAALFLAIELRPVDIRDAGEIPSEVHVQVFNGVYLGVSCLVFSVMALGHQLGLILIGVFAGSSLLRYSGGDSLC
jgi:putative ABC transport system substrate-binding protein